MLVITRRPSELLRIGDDIKIKIRKIEDGLVTLEFIASPQAPIIQPERPTHVTYQDQQETACHCPYSPFLTPKNLTS